MDSIVYPTVSALAAIALLYKLPSLVREPGNVGRRTLVAMLACLFWAPFVNTPAVYFAFDRLVGVPNTARLAAHLGIIGFVASIQVLLLHWTVDAPVRLRTRLRLGSVAAAGAVMIVLFALAPVHTVSTTEFTVIYGDAPLVPQYMLVYLGFFAFALFDIFVLSWRFAVMSASFLRVGLRLVTVGAVFGMVYCIEKGAYVGARLAETELFSDGVQEIISPLLTGTGSLLILTGFTIPAWGPRLVAMILWVRRCVTFWRLHQLWKTMHLAAPEIVLEPVKGWHHLISLRDIEYRTIRRVVEIRDGWLALRPYLDGRLATAVQAACDNAGVSDKRIQPCIYAALITHASQARCRGAERPADNFRGTFGGNDLTGETTALLEIARQMRSRVVIGTVTQHPHLSGTRLN